MTTAQVTEQQVTDDLVVLNLQNVRLTDEQFVELCADNRDLLLEITAQEELLIMSPPGPRTGRQCEPITTDLANWTRQDGTGLTFAPPTLFRLPNGAKRAPDASWIRREKWDALTEHEKAETVPLLIPDFIVELMSPSDRGRRRFRMLQSKMQEYIDNGVRLGWMIDPFEKTVYIYRPGQPVETLQEPDRISGEPVLPGFVFDIAEVWRR